MRVTVVLPLSRPTLLLRAFENFKRQTYPDKRLCVVENGEAVGAVERSGLAVDLVLSSAPQTAAAWNRAVEHHRSTDEYLVHMDDDDYYGPLYLEEHAREARLGQVAGKLPHWVRFSPGQLFLFARDKANRDGHWARGGTLGYFAKEAPSFPDLRVGEDIGFCRTFRHGGGKVRNLGVGHVIYERSAKHAHNYAVMPRQFAYNHGPWFELHRDDEELVGLSEPPLGPRENWTWFAENGDNG